MEQIPQIQWFPGHMAKTRRLMAENLKLVDLVFELRDARIPQSSANPEIDQLLADAKRIILFNKADLADPEATQLWCAHYRALGYRVLAVDCRSGKGVKEILPAARGMLEQHRQAARARGKTGEQCSIMVVGIPNVGKSSLINRLAGKGRAKVEDRPGVTRGKQWVRIGPDVELLDMPGVLWPKFEDPRVGMLLAFTGAVKDNILDIETLATAFLQQMRLRYPQPLVERFGLKMDAGEVSRMQPHELLEAIGRRRGMLLPGSVVDTERAAVMLLDEYRAGRLGRMTFELPGQREDEGDDGR